MTGSGDTSRQWRMADGGGGARQRRCTAHGGGGRATCRRWLRRLRTAEARGRRTVQARERRLIAQQTGGGGSRGGAAWGQTLTAPLPSYGPLTARLAWAAMGHAPRAQAGQQA